VGLRAPSKLKKLEANGRSIHLNLTNENRHRIRVEEREIISTPYDVRCWACGCFDLHHPVWKLRSADQSFSHRGWCHVPAVYVHWDLLRRLSCILDPMRYLLERHVPHVYPLREHWRSRVVHVKHAAGAGCRLYRAWARYVCLGTLRDAHCEPAPACLARKHQDETAHRTLACRVGQRGDSVCSE
jgi:hypothetical protein